VILDFWFCAFFSGTALESVTGWDKFSLELLCVSLMTGRAHKKRTKDGTSFFGVEPLNTGLATCWSKTVSVLLFFLHNINHSSLPVVRDAQCYQREALIPG